MKIIRLQAENIKRLKAVEITPQGNKVGIYIEDGEVRSVPTLFDSGGVDNAV